MQGAYFSLFAIGFVCIATNLVDGAALKSDMYEFEVMTGTISTVSAKKAIKFTRAYLMPKSGEFRSTTASKLYYVDEDNRRHLVEILDSNDQIEKKINIFLPPETSTRFSMSGPRSLLLVGYEFQHDDYKSIPMDERFPYYKNNEDLEAHIASKI